MIKKFLGILLSCILVLGSLLFVACSDPFDDEDNQEQVDGKTTVRVMCQNDPLEKELMMQWKRGFEAQNSEINIYVETFTGAYQNEMLRLIGAKDLPDITWMGGNVHANFSSNGHYVDLRPYLERDGISTDIFNEISLESTHYNSTDEGIWFIPRDYNEIVTYVNVDIFAQAGIEVPTPEEFDEKLFFEICGKLRAAYDEGKIKTAGKKDKPVLLDMGWDPIGKAILASYNAYDYGPNGELGLETEDAKLAYKRVGEYVMRDYAYMPATSDSDQFTTQRCAFTFNVRPYLASAIKAGVNVQALPFPFAKTSAGCSGYGICTVSEVKDEAWEFIKYIISDEGQNIFGQSGMGVPSIESQWETTNWNQYYKTEEQGFNHSVFTTPTRGLSEGTVNERVIDVNSINIYDPAKHLTILQNTSAIYAALGRESTWTGSPLAYQVIPKDAYKMDGNWTALDNAISSFLTVIKTEIAK